MSKAQDQSAIGRGYASNDELHRECVSQESPMPQSINEQYDEPMLSYNDLNQLVHKLNRFNVEKQAKLDVQQAQFDEIRQACGSRNHPGVNISVHALANTILRIIGG